MALGWQKQEEVNAKGRKTLSFKTPPKPGETSGRNISRALQLREFKSFATILFPNSLEAKDLKADNSQVSPISIKHNGTNSGKSVVVIWKNLPLGIPEGLMTRGNSRGQMFLITTEDFLLFVRLLD